MDIDSVLEVVCPVIGPRIDCGLSDEITSERDTVGERLVRGSVSICTSVQHVFLEKKHLFNEKEISCFSN